VEILDICLYREGATAALNRPGNSNRKGFGAKQRQIDLSWNC